ncbi:MAG: NMD3-related protein [Candidatus Aenigmatarchaeota archaeon]
MREKFCPKCGKKTEKFFENLCEECFLSKISFSKIFPEKIIIKQCGGCGKFFIEKLSSTSLEGLIDSFLQRFLKKEGIISIKYSLEENRIDLRIISRTEGLKKEEEKKIDLKFKKIVCQYCWMKSSGYFQAVIQVRAPIDLLEEVEEDVEKQIKTLKEFDDLAFISKMERRKNGFDFFLGSKNSANRIARYLKEKYGGKMKITRKFVGYSKGKKIYRDTILISIP